jgi:hypothetical protein
MSRLAAVRAWRWWPAAIAAAAAVVLAVGVVAFLHLAHGGSGIQGEDLRGNTVALEDDAGLTPSIVAAMHASADTGERFRVASVGLDVPLGALDETAGTITPPGFAAAYRVRNLGVAPADAARGTVFIAMHSLRDGAVGPGNYLIDVAKKRAKVKIGALIDVAGVTYRVTEARAVSKTAISHDRSVWANVPDRLVVITCLQRPEGGPSRDNMVITAMRADTDAAASAAP